MGDSEMLYKCRLCGKYFGIVVEKVNETLNDLEIDMEENKLFLTVVHTDCGRGYGIADLQGLSMESEK